MEPEAPRRQASVAVVGSRIAAVGKIDESGREEIDAEGCVVSPGFVDGHTHMDAQVFWDELGTSSCWHGVTTVVMGNCGFTLAPARPDGRALVVRNLERAEDISADAMAEGIVWTWATFGEYLDAVDATAKGINYACCIGHSALRTWAMGERAFSDPASSDDLAVMERELIDGLHAGAVGFSTSRSPSHATPDGRPVASRLASWEEVEALVDVVRRTSSAGFQLAAEFLTPESLGPRDPAEREHYKRRLQRLALSSGVPTIFGLERGAYQHEHAGGHRGDCGRWWPDVWTHKLSGCILDILVPDPPSVRRPGRMGQIAWRAPGPPAPFVAGSGPSGQVGP